MLDTDTIQIVADLGELGEADLLVSYIYRDESEDYVKHEVVSVTKVIAQLPIKPDVDITKLCTSEDFRLLVQNEVDEANTGLTVEEVNAEIMADAQYERMIA